MIIGKKILTLQKTKEMKRVLIGTFAILGIIFLMSFGRTQALSGLAGTGGTDKYVSYGVLITFNEPIWGFSISGTTTGVIDSLVTSSGGVSGGVYNYLDSAYTLRPGETYAFDNAVTKLRITTGVEFMVNYEE